MSTLVGPFHLFGDDTVVVEIDEALYSADVLFRTCYVFTDRAYLYLCRAVGGLVHVHISPKVTGADLRVMAGEFCNELVDFRVRSLVAAESGKIRELIVAQAFAEGNLLEDLGEETAQTDGQMPDPLGIGDFHG